uniref:L-lactate dehydrogenase n=1 Tax=Hucho hucho TaxID=62062 RepID=A0A4W5JZK3_9TELE
MPCLLSERNHISPRPGGGNTKVTILGVGNVSMACSLNYSDTANSKLCVITAGVRQRKGESCLDLVQRNHSPDTIFPSNSLHHNRVSGTNLDSIHPSSVHGHIIGEHGDSSGETLPCIRSKTASQSIHTKICITRELEAGGKCLFSAYEVIRLKGHTPWVIGLSVSSLAQVILKNFSTIHPVSTLVKVGRSAKSVQKNITVVTDVVSCTVTTSKH